MMGTADRAIRVLIVDDHPMVRQGLRSMLTATGIAVVAEAGSGQEALARIAETEVDVVLLDVRLPDMNGLAVLRALRDRSLATRVLIVTMVEDHWLVRDALALGAAGYVLKGIDQQSLLSAIRTVAAGAAVIDSALLRAVVDERSPTGTGPPARPGSEPLTAAEIELLRSLARGLTNRQIAERMHWSVGTVKKYVQRLLEKLEVADRTEAAAVAVRRGLVD